MTDTEYAQLDNRIQAILYELNQLRWAMSNMMPAKPPSESTAAVCNDKQEKLK